MPYGESAKRCVVGNELENISVDKDSERWYIYNMKDDIAVKVPKRTYRLLQQVRKNSRLPIKYAIEKAVQEYLSNHPELLNESVS